MLFVRVCVYPRTQLALASALSHLRAYHSLVVRTHTNTLTRNRTRVCAHASSVANANRFALEPCIIALIIIIDVLAQRFQRKHADLLVLCAREFHTGRCRFDDRTR